MKWEEERDNLERMINVEHLSYAEIGRRYNVCDNTIKKHAKKLGICLKPRRKINECETFKRKERQEEKKLFIEEEYHLNSVKVKNRKNLGEIGERIAIGELAKYGIDVILPLSDNLPFDFVIYKNQKFYKCQVKTSRQISENNSLIFSLVTNNWHNKKIYKYTENDVDIFICCDLNTIYLFPFNELKGKKTINIRYTKPKNGQTKNVYCAHDYKLSTEIINKIFK